MAYFRGLDSLFMAIETDINNALKDEVSKHAIEELKQSIRDNVYEKYTPSGKEPYKRLYDKTGGFLHDDSFLIEEINPYTVMVRSIRKDGDRDVAYIVEEGQPYTWTHSKIYQNQPYPRPFHKPAKEKMESTQSYVEAMREALAEKGYRFY